jgi:putative flippase GtrA
LIKKQITLYLLIGAFHNLIFLLFYYFFTNHLNIDPTIFIVFSYPIFIFIPFYLNGKYTFNKKISFEKYLKFFSSFAIILLSNIFFLEIFYRYLKFNHTYVQIFFTILCAIISFLISKYFIFRKKN